MIESMVSHTDVIREDPPGVPLYHVPISDVADLKRGDHILYQVCQEPYSACYRSALVTDIEETKIHVVMNSSDGVKEERLDFFHFKNFYLIKYSHCYSSDEVVQRAMQRLEWNENCYHCLYNNSHHFVTLAKTGRENPLTEIIESLMHQGGKFCSTLFLLSCIQKQLKQYDILIVGDLMHFRFYLIVSMGMHSLW